MDPKHLEMMDEQIALEQEMLSQGVANYRKREAAAQEKGREAKTDYGKRLMSSMHTPTRERILEWIDVAENGATKGGPKPTALKYLKRFDPDLLVALTLRTLLDSVSRSMNYGTVATRLGTYLETEERLGAFEKERAGLFKHIRKGMDKRGAGEAWQRTVLLHSKGKHGVEDNKWPLTDKLHVGKLLIELCIEATRGFTRENVRTGPRACDRRVILKLSDELLDACRRVSARFEVLSPSWMPTIVPPRPWTNPRSGGYWYSERLALVKDNRWTYREELMGRIEEMQEVYEAINTVQETPWQVNKRVLDVLENIWEAHGGDLASLPPADDIPLPSTASIIEGDDESLLSWKRAASKVYEANVKLVSKRLMLVRTLSLARRFADYDSIWFPMQFDFRGRMYAVPKFLQPQGDDVAKSLLTFAEGKPIEDSTAAGWLAVHGANVYGFDKASFDERIEWVEEHHDAIMFAAADPLSAKWWMDADKPWQFLAFCFEWAAFQDHGYGYVSHLPVALDGSCNGLQHFSAMLRDSVGGKATNLLPCAAPADIYQEVANVVMARLQVLTDKHQPTEEERDLAGAWLRLGINRKTVKRPVMVLPYGGTAFSCREYLEEWLREQDQEVFAEEEIFKATKFLADIVWASIGQVVVAARLAMDWLQKSARIAAKEGIPLQWETPDGFPVMQAYATFRKKRVKTKLGDTLMYIQLREEIENELDTKRQANGASPNFVHSLDATAMRMYVNIGKDNGITHFGLVHDSFATHAADTELSAACIRHAFVDLYASDDVLALMRESLCQVVDDPESIPKVPPMGDLQLESILEAPYFFA